MFKKNDGKIATKFSYEVAFYVLLSTLLSNHQAILLKPGHRRVQGMYGGGGI
jgi:hypothetical protein